MTRASAVCTECPWRTASRGAIGAAAQHYDRTGHLVKAEENVWVEFGERL